jgi:hypothetical protein
MRSRQMASAMVRRRRSEDRNTGVAYCSDGNSIGVRDWKLI